MSIKTTITIAFYLLVLWYIVFVAGTIQYRVLKKRTIQLILKYAQQAMDGGLDRSYESLYQALYPEWCVMVKKTAVFIPDKTELYPIPANVKNVKKRLIFTPRWVKDCLIDHKIIFEPNK
jgi:hypothetical protein